MSASIELDLSGGDGNVILILKEDHKLVEDLKSDLNYYGNMFSDFLTRGYYG